MTTTGSVGAPVAALGAILAVTASWWALALWPAGDAPPDWLLLTREVCFGATADRLPDAAGWVLLVAQPFCMLALLAAAWGAELRRGLGLAMGRAAGQLGIGVTLAILVAGLCGVIVRVRTVGRQPFATGAANAAAALTRVNDPAPALVLRDQHGRTVSLESFRGRPALVAFAYAHCETVCPLIVSDVLSARRQAGGSHPVVLLVTLDPWRDTPSRLSSIATRWNLDEDAYVLSGPPEAVERTLSGWRVARVRNEKTGDISHPSMVYVIDAAGRIAYVLNGGAAAITAALRTL